MRVAGEGSDYDIAIIGGGINGCGIARDAAGRGLCVFLCEQADLGSGTSSASTKLIHGGLRYLEHYEFRLVREALMEREVLWRIAPHIIWPLRFVLPYHRALRPAWLLRLGLFLYDHLGGRKLLPPTRTLRLDRDLAGALLKPDFIRGFEYSDCWVEDSRLVVLNALDAAEHGAVIAPRTACLEAERSGGGWLLSLRDEASGRLHTVRAKTLVNATGPWVGQVAGGVIRANTPVTVRLVQGSHIVVPRLHGHEASYIFQNEDGRIFFLIPPPPMSAISPSSAPPIRIIAAIPAAFMPARPRSTICAARPAPICASRSRRIGWCGRIRASGRYSMTAPPRRRRRRAIMC